MELPTEIWSCILQKTRTIKNCNKLYTAFTSKVKAELKDIYETHKKKIVNKKQTKENSEQMVQ